MLKPISLFAASLGLFAAAAFFMGTGESRLEAREDQRGCVSRQVSLDEGYGVTRVETRQVCDQRGNPFGGL